MKVFISLLLLSAAALGQPVDGAKVITFNRADTEHCKVLTVDNKPLLVTTYDGTSVAVGMPTHWGNGEFSVFVSVYQAGAGVADIDPKQIYALYSDTAHTRLEWFNKGREIDPWESGRKQVVPGERGVDFYRDGRVDCRLIAVQQAREERSRWWSRGGAGVRTHLEGAEGLGC